MGSEAVLSVCLIVYTSQVVTLGLEPRVLHFRMWPSTQRAETIPDICYRVVRCNALGSSPRVTICGWWTTSFRDDTPMRQRP